MKRELWHELFEKIDKGLKKLEGNSNWNVYLMFFRKYDKSYTQIKIPTPCMVDKKIMLFLFDIVEQYGLKITLTNREEFVIAEVESEK